jgi:hypothetical protein
MCDKLTDRSECDIGLMLIMTSVADYLMALQILKETKCPEQMKD